MDTQNEKPNKCLTYKQSAFCHEIVQGLSQTESYRAAYPGTKMSTKTMKEAASRLMRDSNVMATIKELKAPAVEKVKRSYEQWLQEVEDVAFVQTEQLDVKTSDKLKALELFSKATGYYQEKLETPMTALENTSTELLVAMLAELKERKAAREAIIIEGSAAGQS